MFGYKWMHSRILLWVSLSMDALLINIKGCTLNIALSLSIKRYTLEYCFELIYQRCTVEYYFYLSLSIKGYTPLNIALRLQMYLSMDALLNIALSLLIKGCTLEIALRLSIKGCTLEYCFEIIYQRMHPWILLWDYKCIYQWMHSWILLLIEFIN